MSGLTCFRPTNGWRTRLKALPLWRRAPVFCLFSRTPLDHRRRSASSEPCSSFDLIGGENRLLHVDSNTLKEISTPEEYLSKPLRGIIFFVEHFFGAFLCLCCPCESLSALTRFSTNNGLSNVECNGRKSQRKRPGCGRVTSTNSASRPSLRTWKRREGIAGEVSSDARYNDQYHLPGWTSTCATSTSARSSTKTGERMPEERGRLATPWNGSLSSTRT